MKKTLFILTGICFLLFLYAVLIEPYLLKITRYTLKNDDLSGVRIVFASDFHFGTNPLEQYRLQKVLHAIKQQNADLVLLGGDYVKGHTKTSAIAKDKLVAFLQEIPNPAYAVLGNHDSYYGKVEILQMFKSASVPILDNQNRQIILQGKKATIAGLADYYTDTPNLSKALEAAENPIILLMHTPDTLTQSKTKADIILTGHTHGGQVVLPIIGALLIPLDNDKKYQYGLFYENNTPIIVSGGLGTSLLPVRFNNLPEIVVIEFE